MLSGVGRVGILLVFLAASVSSYNLATLHQPHHLARAGAVSMMGRAEKRAAGEGEPSQRLSFTVWTFTAVELYRVTMES